MLTLVIQDSEYLVENGNKVLILSRKTGAVRVVGAEKDESARALNSVSKPILGVLGVIDLPNAKKVLAVITDAVKRGSIENTPVFEVKRTALYPLSAANGAEDEDADGLKLVKSHLNAAKLFFSRYNLTSSAQRQSTLGSDVLDDRFVWNWQASESLKPYPEFFFPVIYGVFSHSTAVVNGRELHFALITRRSRFRAGTRYFRRGLDFEGHAANFNETEQLLTISDDGRLFSYVQTRGSVPALWSEVNNLKYKPQLRIGDLSASVEAAKRHFADQEQRYGHQFLVNLVNQSGYEKPVKDVYESVVNVLRDPEIIYVYFDFHHECSKMRWHRVQLLIDDLKSRGLDESGYFERGPQGTVARRQTAVVRTNCMDCLDRTNVVQSTIALYELERQLVEAGITSAGATVSSDAAFMAVFRKIWADNADGVSVAYSGTGALKTDFTRTGKRTKVGALQDLRNSIVRYYRNNFRDGPRQDGFSLFLGDFDKSAPRRLPFADRRPLPVQAVPYISGGCALVTLLSILYPSETHSTLFNTIVTLTFAVVAAVSLRVMVTNGMQYVNWPKLSPVRFVQWTGKEYELEGAKSSKEE